MKVGDKVHVEIGEIDPKGKLSLIPVIEDSASE
jgi:polyribonucleotide nucleotidyltransferase